MGLSSVPPASESGLWSKSGTDPGSRTDEAGASHRWQIGRGVEARPRRLEEDESRSSLGGGEAPEQRRGLARGRSGSRPQSGGGSVARGHPFWNMGAPRIQARGGAPLRMPGTGPRAHSPLPSTWGRLLRRRPQII
ncbi:unnamed protein product, partial [Ixodes pacificus]